MEYSAIKAMAAGIGITALHGKELAAYEPFSDGCSGRLSWVYSLAGRKISCHRACVAHDFLYEWGGDAADRKRADRLLRLAAAGSGRFEGWRAPLRRRWRGARAWIMYAAVRLFGKSHWNGG